VKVGASAVDVATAAPPSAGRTAQAYIDWAPPAMGRKSHTTKSNRTMW